MNKRKSDLNEFNIDLINNELINKHIHFLFGDINEYNIENVIKWIVFENMVQGKDNDKVLTLYINSDGGNVNDALALIDIMNQSKFKIRTIGIGSVISSAFLIFISGSKGERYISKNASIMCHQFSHSFDGKFHDIKSQMKENEYLNERMENIILNNSILDLKKIRTHLLKADDVWLKPEEAINYGVADFILK